MIAEPSPDPTTAGRTRLLLMLAALPAVAGVLLVLGLALIGSENQLLASLKDDGRS